MFVASWRARGFSPVTIDNDIGQLKRTLATMRDLALFLVNERNKGDWSLIDVHDIEAFLNTLPRGWCCRPDP